MSLVDSLGDCCLASFATLCVQGYRPSEASASDATSAKERRALLFEDFGASKKKRALAASAANQVSAEQAVGAEAINAWMAEGEDPDGEGAADTTEAALEEGRKHLLPAYDPAASSAEECYDIGSILGAKERGALGRQYAELAKSCGWEGAAGWPAFVLRRLARAHEAKDREACIDLIGLKHLIAFHLRKSKIFKGATKDDARDLDMPAEVLRFLQSRSVFIFLFLFLF